MKRFLLFASICLSFGTNTKAQIVPTMNLIQGGTFIMGGGYQYKILGYRMHLLEQDSAFAAMNAETPAIGEIPQGNNPTRIVTVANFEIAQTEVTNLQYREFLIDSLLTGEERMVFEKALKGISKGKSNLSQNDLYKPILEKATARGLMPDTSVWSSDFPASYNAPLTRFYFLHPAYDQYPVVGVSWHQANAYCAWLTNHVNKERATKGDKPMPAFRLPTEGEWEYASRGRTVNDVEGEIPLKQIYPFPGRSLVDESNHYRMNTKVMPGEYALDGYEYTCPVTAFPPNGFKLYGMGGNVSEWVADSFVSNGLVDKTLVPTRPGAQNGPWIISDSAVGQPELRVIKGGSWADFPYAAMCGSRAPMEADKGYSRVGFRVARIVAPE